MAGRERRATAEREVRERLLKGMGEAVAAYEATFGVISEDELEAQRRADAKSAIVVRGRCALYTLNLKWMTSPSLTT